MLQNSKPLGLNPGDALHFFDTVFLRRIGSSRACKMMLQLVGYRYKYKAMRDLLLSDAVLEVNFNGPILPIYQRNKTIGLKIFWMFWGFQTLEFLQTLLACVLMTIDLKHDPSKVMQPHVFRICRA